MTTPTTTMQKVLVDILDEQRLPVPKRKLKSWARQVIMSLSGKDIELSVLLADDVRMTSLNRQHRAMDRTTDVLSFPQFDQHAGIDLHEAGQGACLLGDVVICPEHIAKAAGFLSERGALIKSCRSAYELALQRRLVHGILHLFGSDHEAADDKGKMLRAENRLIEQIEKGSR